MFIEGLLYEYLSHEQIETLQQITSYISSGGETYINDQIKFNKKAFIKETAIGDVDYHEGKLKDYKKSLNDIMISLKSRI